MYYLIWIPKLQIRFERVKGSECRPVFERYWRCLEMNNQDFIYCREEDLALHQCTQKHLVHIEYIIFIYSYLM